jgi:hypothetical protein
MWSRRYTHARSRVWVLLACSGVALVVVVLAPPCPSAASEKQTIRVGLFGDSLAVQSEPYFNFIVQAGARADVTDFSYGGTAACDWLSKMRKYARTEHPQAVVFEFIGNTFTACMKGCLFGSPAAVTLYCSAISTAINVFLGLGTHVFLVGTPITRSEWVTHDSKWDALNRSSDLRRRGESGRGARAVLRLDVAVPLLRAMHWPDDRRGENQRGPFTRWGSLLSEPDRQRRGRRSRL